MRFAVFVVVVALAARLAAVLWLSDTVPYSDFALYHVAGVEIARVPGFLFDRAAAARFPHINLWPPAYPAFLAAVYTLFGPSYRSAVFVQVLLGACVCWLVLRLAVRVGSQSIGRIAALLVALDPIYVFFTNQLASENLFAFWLVLGFLLLEREVGPASGKRAAAPRGAEPRRDNPALLLPGAVLGLAALTRAIGLVLPVVALLWLRGPDRRAWLARGAWLWLGFAAVIAPWTLRNAVVVGRPALVCFGGGLNFCFGHNAAGVGHRDLAGTPLAGLRDPAAIDAAGYREGARFIAARPLGFVTRGARKVGALYGFPDDALHMNSGILIPDTRGRPDLEALAQQKLSRQRQRDRLLHGPLMHCARVFHVFLLGLALATILWRRTCEPSGATRPYVWLLLAWTAAHVLFWAQPRFFHPMHIPLALLGAFTLLRFGQHGHRVLSGSKAPARLAG